MKQTYIKPQATLHHFEGCPVMDTDMPVSGFYDGDPNKNAKRTTFHDIWDDDYDVEQQQEIAQSKDLPHFSVWD